MVVGENVGAAVVDKRFQEGSLLDDLVDDEVGRWRKCR